MNAIQQISLKLQMGIAPDVEIQPQMLRAMWLELANEANDPRADRTPASRLAGKTLENSPKHES